MRWLIVPILLMMAACTTMTKPESPRDALVVAEISYQGVLVSVQELASAGFISSDDAEILVPYLDKMYGALMIARLAIDMGDSETASAQLRIVDAILPVLISEITRLRNKELSTEGLAA